MIHASNFQMDKSTPSADLALNLNATNDFTSSGAAQPLVVFARDYTPQFDALISLNDSLAFLKTVPTGTARLIVSSPPYNIGKPYEQKLAMSEYLAHQELVLTECVRILQNDGSLCWEVGNYANSGEILPLDIPFFHILKEKLNLKLRNRIVWHFGHGLHARKRFSGRYEVVLWFTKSDSYVFNLDPVRVPQKYPGKRYFKGPNKGRLSGNPLGKNPGDIWQQLSEEWSEEVWDIPNVKWNHPEKTVHPAQFPIELVERLVLALSKSHDVVLDPFMGAGSTLLAALIHGRRGVGVDNHEEYVGIARRRIAALQNGTLKRRRLGTIKHSPTGNEKVAQRPIDWIATS